MIISYRVLQAGPVPPAGGPDRDAYLRENGTRALHEATAKYQQALAALQLIDQPAASLTNDKATDIASLESMSRRWDQIRSQMNEDHLAVQKPILEAAVDQAIRALNFLEDTEVADAAHQLIHQTAKLRAGLYGCRPWLKDGKVWTDCPVRISHLRWGASAEMKTVWVCSICRERFDTCRHDPDTFYEVTASHSDGTCSVCFEEHCEHQDNTTYEVRPTMVAAAITAGAIAVVTRPRYPQARALTMTLPCIAGSPRYEAAATGTLLCHVCELPCPGWTLLPD